MGQGDAGGRRWLVWLAPVVLVAIALLQIALAHGVGLTPWKGGGFGMFATTDHGGFRSLRVVAIRADRKERVPTTSSLDRERRAARILPSRGRLVGIARQVLPGLDPDVTALRIEVWRTVFAPGDLRPDRRLVRSVRVERQDLESEAP